MKNDMTLNCFPRHQQMMYLKTDHKIIHPIYLESFSTCEIILSHYIYKSANSAKVKCIRLQDSFTNVIAKWPKSS